jgi:hypothetical protein
MPMLTPLSIATLPVGYLPADKRFLSTSTPWLAVTGPGGLNPHQLVTHLESRNGYSGIGQSP